ncbi:MAG: translation initiation factor IF-3 [Gammaproteobacteria bacterium]|nr:translation initiation factor IF-3 [Gammaproteobacteria bacterium]MYD75412.1 translation initiation factor IF-3 [Gammaproteobacteria bacterium]
MASHIVRYNSRIQTLTRITEIAKLKQLRINAQITSDPIRLIQADGQQTGIVPLAEALEAAEDTGVDLVEISPNAEPPVCRLMDYGKYLYNESKRRHDAKKKQKQMTVKEIKFRPGTDIGDYDVKVRKLTEFLGAGNKTKVTMRFRGREMAHKELGMEMLERVRDDLESISEVEQDAQMEGRQMVMILTPKR